LIDSLKGPPKAPLANFLMRRKHIVQDGA